MTAEDLELLESRLSDPLWRLTSGEIYKIKTADGRGIIPFLPRPEQVALLVELVQAMEAIRTKVDGWEKLAQKVKLKARRLGYSTTIGVFIADCLGFRKSFTATLIDQTGDDSKKKMNDIVKVALASLRESWPLRVLKENDSELSVDLDIDEDTDGSGVSTFYAGTKARGGSNDLLWCSELGVIQFEDEPRAEEIITGAFPSARHGLKIVETTWKGGKGGKLYSIIKPTLDGEADDWSVTFTPWYVDPRNVNPTASHDAESLAYFAKIEPRLQREGITLSDVQRRWWAAERRTLGIFMQRENPTFLDECWTAPIEGSIYAAAIERARAEGRICSMPIDGNNLVNTSWDLGAPANTIVWYWQIVGREIRIVDCDQEFDGTLVERAAMMKAKGYPFGKHFLPHDSLQTERSGATAMSELAPHLPGLVAVPKCHTEWVGINHLLQLFSALAFRVGTTDAGKRVDAALETLGCFHVRKDGTQEGEPKHDWSSHTADALRTMAEAHRAALFKFSATTAEPRPDWHGNQKRRGMKPRIISGIRI
jgi:hypothetical protein